MKKKIMYNKLVRDKIPEIIESKGANLKSRILDNDEYITELKKKMLEEAKEVTNEKEDILSELADIIEIVESIGKIKGYTLEDIKNQQIAKKTKNGGFLKKIFLEWAEEN